MRVLVFGASVAQGYWDSEGGWAARLQRHYDSQQMKDFTADLPRVMNLGISGDTSEQVLKRIGSESAARQNSKGISIIIQVGGNNAAEENGHTRTTSEQYQNEIKEIIQQAKKFTNKIMVVGFQCVDESKTTPVPWVDYHYKNSNMLVFEKAAQTICAQIHIPFVPVHEQFKQAVDNGNNLLSHDGLHPNDEGHKLIFELVRPELDRLLHT
jgi:lysophospholipase L1-like esterase